MNKRFRKMMDEPNMSDKTLLLSVEDLISRAFGTDSKNTVNFKLVQTILHILARQLRLLEQDVEIKFDDIGIDFETGRPYYDSDDYDSDYDYYSDDVSYSSSSLEPERVGISGARKEGSKKRGEKERDEKEEEKERGQKGEKREKKERGEKGTKKDRREKGEKGEREDQGETGEKKEKRSKDRRRGSKDRGSSSPDGRIDEDVVEGKGRDGRKKRHGGRRKRGEDDEDEGGERDGHGRRHGGRRRRGEDDEDEGGERDGHSRRHGGRGRRGEDDEDEGGERDGYGRRRGGRRRRGEDDEDEGGERDGYGRRHGGRRRRGEDDEDVGGERDGYGRRHGGQRRRGEDDGDEGDERDGRRHGRSRDRDREDRRYGERRGDYYDRDERRRRHRADREGSGTSITVTEGQRRGGGGGTVLIAERGPMTRGRVARVGSIEVVTASQFALLARAVRQLEQVTGPLPIPELPENEQLREDVLKGRASLSDTMEAVQLNARVQAAEEGLSRMAGLLTQLTAAGALPMDFASRIGDLQAELRKPSMSSKRSSVEQRDLPLGPESESRVVPTRIAEDEEHDDADAGAELQQEEAQSPIIVKPFSGGTGGLAGTSATSRTGGSPTYEDMPVTHNEMQEILEQMKEALTKEIQAMTARANHSADIASNTSRNVSEKLAIALAIDERISTLYSQTADYAEQLNGFDTGLTTQMASFQEQMAMMRTDLKGGLELLESANNNAETAAVLDLTERYDILVIELDGTVHLHNNLSIVQQQISAELKTLVECVEMLREQKADRDEVLDGLRDKADLTRLSGLLYEKDFAQARFEIEKRIEKSYDKFYKQDEVWQIAMRDLTSITDHKAEVVALMAFKERTMKELNKIQQKQQQLEMMLGEPQAALLTRTLAAGATCGSCLTPAVMPLTDATHGKPALLPALRPAPLGAEEPCLAEVALRPPDTRRHICLRWVGGSHTLMAGNVSREKAAQSHLESIPPTKKYEGYGTDGKMYMMEEELLPCAECNKFTDDTDDLPPRSPTPTGGGDRPHELLGSRC